MARRGLELAARGNNGTTKIDAVRIVVEARGGVGLHHRYCNPGVALNGEPGGEKKEGEGK